MPTSSVPTPSHSDSWKASDTTPETVDALLRAVHADPFSVLGPHAGPAGQQVVRCMQPQARQVEVIDHRRREAGVWENFIPGVPHGALYKFEVLDAQGQLRFKSDPMARWTEAPPATASRVRHETAFAWTDADWMARRAHTAAHRAPIAIYEVHLGSWQRGPDGETLGYTELAEQLVPYAVQMGFTHLELLPVSEHPFGGSW